MQRALKWIFVFTIVTVWSLGAIPTASSQEGSEVESGPGQELETEAQELFAAIDEGQLELAKLREQVAAATGEDAEALRTRASEVAIEMVVDLDKLASNVVAREESGSNVDDDRARVTELLERASRTLRDGVVRLEEEQAELRSTEADAAPEDQAEISERLAAHGAWLGRALELLVDHTLAMEEYGLATDDERTFLAEHLGERAELTAGRVMLVNEQMSSIQRRLSADPTSAEITAELDNATHRLNLYVERLQGTTRMMKTLDLDTADYEQLLFQVTGEVTTGLLSRDVMGGLVAGWTESAKDWIVSSAPSLILKLVLFVLILVVFRFLSKVARRLVRKAIQQSSLAFSTLLERTALSVTGTVVMVFGLLVALSQLGFEIGPLLAGLGVAGFIVGFALQDTLSNFASGVMILLYRPYDVGDLVEAAGVFGKVKDMTLVSTTILTLDHQTLVIPNNKIWGDVIKNVTAQKMRRVDMVFGIGYADDIPHAERVLREIVESHEKVLDDPEPIVKLHTLNESSVDFVVRPWVATDDYWDVYWDITREVKIRFDAENISIPFPQRDVHIYQES